MTQFGRYDAVMGGLEDREYRLRRELRELRLYGGDMEARNDRASQLSAVRSQLRLLRPDGDQNKQGDR
ncbi:MAG TPA: hypothetical protein VIU62_20235 [Chloroflexota bacterium]|jgi:hypothetical protein